MSFLVFLSHSSADKPAVEELARRLAKEGIQAWLDKWNLIPGDPWQPAIEKALAESETCAVFVGPSGFGPWQNEEMRAAIDRRVRDSKRRFRVIPVLLPGAERAERSSLPTFLVATTWVEFRDSLDDQYAFHRLMCGIQGIEPGAGPGQAIYEGQCPYRGLRVFDVDDSPFFFGREALVQWLLNELRPATEGQQVNRFLAIVGSSGSGKSSVARAGLVAALKRDAIPSSSRWPVAVCRPGPDPIESLAVALSRAMNIGQGASALTDLIVELQKNEKTLHLIARQSLPDNAPDVRLVVFVDQFEEVFTLCDKDELRHALVTNLLYAARVAQGQTLVILTMRADFYGKCAVNVELAAAMSDHNFLVGPMTDDELRRAIERPTQLVGCEFDAGLVDLLVQDVRHQPGALPLLEHALLELWNKREGRRLTVKAYQEIGKLDGALQRRADDTLKGFSEAERELCRRTFLRLTQPGEGTEDTKRRVSKQELLSFSGKSAAEEQIIQRLADASLLTTEGDPSQKDAFVEVAHEALIRNWPQLRKWIDADRAGLRTRTRLTEAAREWKNAGRDPTYLYSGGRLLIAEEWAGSHPGELNPDEAEFLRCSREAQQQREASELEAAQRLARAEAERAEEAEKRAKEKEVAYKLRRRAIAALGAAAAAVILLIISVVMWRKSELAGAAAKHNFADAAIYKALFEWQAVVDMTPLYKGEMNLWISSQPESFSSQVVQEFHRDFPAFNLRDKNLSPGAFSNAISENAKDESSPDVAFIDNYRELQPLLAAKAVWQNWGTLEDRFDTRGWWVIFKDAKHVDQARAFFRWLSQSPHWHPMRVKNTALSEEQIQVIQRISSQALNRMLAGDTTGLEVLLDKDAARFGLAPAHENFEPVDVKPLLTFGNAQTAFVLVAALRSGDELYGVKHYAFILRNVGEWRTLYCAGIGLRRAEELFHTFDEKMTSDRKSSLPPKAELVSPPDKARLPRFPAPTIEWKVASSTGLSFILQSQFGQRGDRESWSQGRLDFVDVPEKEQAFAITAPFGVGAQPHRWRIWTLNPSGGISISDWREIDFTN
jgi:hypothetical protein